MIWSLNDHNRPDGKQIIQRRATRLHQGRECTDMDVCTPVVLRFQDLQGTLYKWWACFNGRSLARESPHSLWGQDIIVSLAAPWRPQPLRKLAKRVPPSNGYGLPHPTPLMNVYIYIYSTRLPLHVGVDNVLGILRCPIELRERLRLC